MKKHYNTEEGCHTCKKPNYILKNILFEDDLVTLHKDLKRRPFIICTPIKHYHLVNDVPSETLYRMFDIIKNYMDTNNINGYSILFNNGNWQRHHHFHIKVKYT